MTERHLAKITPTGIEFWGVESGRARRLARLFFHTGELGTY